MATASSTNPLRQNRLLWPVLAAVAAAGAVLAGTAFGVPAPITAAIVALVAIATLGWWLWRAEPDPQKRRSSLGTGLLVSAAVGSAIGAAQFFIEDRRQAIERDRRTSELESAERQGLFTTVASQKSLRAFDLRGRKANGFYFVDKDLDRARFQKAELSEANFEEAKLFGADFSGAELGDASLIGARLESAIFTKAKLGGALVNGANLEGANLVGAVLRGTQLEGARLVRADLRGADLRGAKLRRANLRGADLREATLGGGKLTGAWLRCAKRGDADLRCRYLRRADISRTIFDSTTRWPADFDPGSSGALREP